jgi:hypothetical protein
VLDPELGRRMVERLQCFPAVAPATAPTCAHPAIFVADGVCKACGKPAPCTRTYPLDPLTAEDPCDDCGRDQRKHEIAPGHQGWDLAQRVAAHLAAQPATAPTTYCSRCRERVSTSGPYCASCLAAQPATAPTFEQVWAEKEREGYQYGAEALQQVRFGFELARAAQPATAPTYDPRFESCPCETVDEHQRGACLPTRTEAENDEHVPLPGFPDMTVQRQLLEQGNVRVSLDARDVRAKFARTEAEQRVLEAMAAFDRQTLEYLRERQENYDIEWGGEMAQWVVAACRAELARRGLKP